MNILLLKILNGFNITLENIFFKCFNNKIKIIKIFKIMIDKQKKIQNYKEEYYHGVNNMVESGDGKIGIKIINKF